MKHSVDRQRRIIECAPSTSKSWLYFFHVCLRSLNPFYIRTYYMKDFLDIQYGKLHKGITPNPVILYVQEVVTNFKCQVTV